MTSSESAASSSVDASSTGDSGSTGSDDSLPLPTIEPESLPYCTHFSQANSCLVSFAGYDWWTNFYWTQETGIWVGPPLDQVFDPNNVTVDASGLHLKVGPYDNQGNTVWASAEAVLYRHLGYGKYLFTVQGLAALFASGESNLVFGAFTYHSTASQQANAFIELDALEVSRWGNPVDVPVGAAQFVVQPWDATPSNQQHIVLDAARADPLTVTLQWTGPSESVIYSAYYGAFSWASLPSQPDFTWTACANESDEICPYIPFSQGELFRFNLWQYQAQGPSDGRSHEVTITNFEFLAK